MWFQSLEYAVSRTVFKYFFSCCKTSTRYFSKKKAAVERARARSTAGKTILGYSTGIHKFKRLEPHFQFSATRSASKEGAETAVALAHSRECTKELISALPNIGLMGKFGARAELRNVLQEKKTGQVWFQGLCVKSFFLVLWALQHR